MVSAPPGRRSPIDHATALGTAPVGRLLWHTCSQTTLSVGVYGIYALTNAWFVARGVGPLAMAAVNLATPVLLILGAVSTTVGVGGASLVSRSLGANDPRSAARAAGNAFVVFWATAVLVTVVGLLALDPLLTLLGAVGSTREPAAEYAIVLLAGAIFSTGFSSLVRAEGRMRFSTMLWLVPVLVQITLDPLLIFGFHLGVRGAAIGTVGGQAVSAAMSLWFFFGQRHRPYRIGLADLRPHPPTIRALLGVGAPSFLAGFGATLLAVLVNTTLSRVGGATALAAFAVCARIQTFAMMPQLGISQGLQPVVGYNAGSGLYDRVLRARTLSLRATVGYGVLVLVAVVGFAGPLVAAFVDDPEVASTTRNALRIIALGFAVAGVAPLVSAYFQSLGRARPSYLISVGTILVIKVPLVVAFSHTGSSGVWVSLAMGEVVSALAALVVLRRVRLGD
ncbi:putative efflux protein, MATE family [Actinopolymorpha cephalotaxi]|uniref:Multidrug export protein MepA n=1 Tax=Actinopolymorpha cephalotaxi TaxID=504797 RepID=A0A1I2LYS6_9ACTN|nr:MATE family efflux transporter [Actinopolymorpha cephalotaxi]NYH81480.1 putative MATE family efflux protein [Actinopolymorpha cephalotaxi]SFF83649.1 putative efflux protein, MATE family [Actinopolymorpha cephalotaxi]